MKRLDDMTPQEIAAEVQGWERGDFADGSWKDAPAPVVTREQVAWLLQVRFADGEHHSVRRAKVGQVLLDLADIFEQSELGDALLAAHAAFSSHR